MKNSMLTMMITVTVILIAVSNLFAEQKNVLTAKQQEQIIAELCQKVQNIYPFPEIAEKTAVGMRAYHKEGKYDSYTDKREFANHLTMDLEDLSNDTHFRLSYNPDAAREIVKYDDQAVVHESLTAYEARIEKWQNYGFRELKILEGGIGYLDLRLFFASYYAGETAVAAMNFFANCNAVIIDLRYNGGGWDDMVNFLLSYFAEAHDEVMFNVTQYTIDSSYYAGKTIAYVPGKRLVGIPVYVLISRSTASAAEAFASRIKHVNDHTVLVGETSAGAENPISSVVVGRDFVLNIPSWRPVYRKYKTQWEGVGIKPDIETAPEEALAVAHMDVLKKLTAAAVDKEVKEKYQWALDGVQAVYEPVTLSENMLQTYAGNYGTRDVHYEVGELYYQYKGRTKRRMLPVREDYFVVENYDFFRVRFTKEKDKVTGLEEIFTDGSVMKNTRVE
jgi:hypothetical protein